MSLIHHREGDSASLHPSIDGSAGMKRVFLAMTSMTQDQGLSGEDILNVCVKAIHAGSTDTDPERRMVTQEMMEKEIRKVRRAKAEHSGEKSKSRRRIGFQPS